MSTDRPASHGYNDSLSNGQDPAIQEDLARVREIILGPDALRERMKGAESDRLREILFGPQAEEYERRFADLRRELERVANDLRQAQERLAEVEKSTSRRVESLELTVRRLSDDARRESERGRSRDTLLQQLATQLRQHDETIGGVGEGMLELRKSHTAAETEGRSIRTDLIDARDQIEQRAQMVRREIRHTEDTLRTEMRRVTDRLDHQKTDRRALASMLIEIAARLETGNSVTGLLEGLSGPKE